LELARQHEARQSASIGHSGLTRAHDRGICGEGELMRGLRGETSDGVGSFRSAVLTERDGGADRFDDDSGVMFALVRCNNGGRGSALIVAVF